VKTVWRPELRPGTRWGSLQRSRSPSRGKGLAVPSPRTPPPRAGLGFRPFATVEKNPGYGPVLVFSVGVFIDLSKAFDTLNHKILLNKISYYGIRGVALSWFTSYLQNRLQYVSLNGHLSDTLEITCGVPQGSILGPMLFLIHINDITSATNLFHLILFADDTNMFLSDKDVPSLIAKTNIELDALYKWLLANKLSLNVDKTNFIILVEKGLVQHIPMFL